MGFLDRRENQAQQQAVLKRLLNGRDDQLYQKLYGTKHALYTEPRSASGKNRVMPFWN